MTLSQISFRMGLQIMECPEQGVGGHFAPRPGFRVLLTSLSIQPWGPLCSGSGHLEARRQAQGRAQAQALAQLSLAFLW